MKKKEVVKDLFCVAGEGWKAEKLYNTVGGMKDEVRRIAQKIPNQLLELTVAPKKGRCKDMGYGKAIDLKNKF